MIKSLDTKTGLYFGNKNSVMEEAYPEASFNFIDKQAITTGTILKDMIKDVNSYKNTNRIEQIALTIIDKNKEFDNIMLKFLQIKTNARKLEVVKQSDKLYNIITTGVVYNYDNNISLIIEASLTKEEILNRLKADLIEVNGEIARCEGMLNNTSFMSKAPKNKIEEEQNKYRKYTNTRKNIEKQINELNS